MSKIEVPSQLIDGEVKEDKAAYERPALRRIGRLRDVTAIGASNGT